MHTTHTLISDLGVGRNGLAFYIEYYKYVRDLCPGRRKLVKSYANFDSAHILPVGDLQEGAVHIKKMGELRDYTYNFKKLWCSEQGWKVREYPHGNNSELRESLQNFEYKIQHEKKNTKIC